jgi:curli biogenesis system outer membrane secretion channel CsgG
MRNVCVSSIVSFVGGLALAGAVGAQPTFESASPTAGSDTSERANAMADKAMYKSIEYTNAGTKGPMLVVIPGEIKSSNATFLQKFGPNNIADFGEIELSKANFQVLERSNLGPLLNEFTLAYNLGDPNKAREYLGIGKLKSTKYIVKFDILKTEQVASAQEGFDGAAIGRVIGLLGAFSGSTGGARAGAIGGTAVGSVKTGDTSGVWIIGMRYKIMDAETTEQLAQGYTEEKMEIGATGTSVMGVSSSAQGGVGLDTMVQRLVQKSVWEIDSKHK